MIQIDGIVPSAAVLADHFPRRTETGIGGLMPWAQKLWFITYVAHKSGSGGGTGLFSVDENMKVTKHPASVVGTYANRMIHTESNQCIIGPHLIDTDGKVRTAEDLVDIRITATARHLEDPESKVYMLGMEGEFFEMDVHTLKCTQLANLLKELDLNYMKGLGIPHFKGMYSGHGRVVVANNSYQDNDYLGETAYGRLAEWDGDSWTILETCQFNEVMGRTSIGKSIFATGADNASAILKVFLPDGPRAGWNTYRLPKATHTQDHSVTTEWPRIREIESERWMINASGMFYELPAMQYGGHVWGVRPVCTHLRIIGDYCSWRGMLVLAGDQTTPINDSNPYVGQPQANLWFGKSDDLWNFGKPKGWGGPWRDTEVKPGKPSDPFLMTGFEDKCLHIEHYGGSKAKFTIEVDFTGDGRWHPYAELSGRDMYLNHVFPTGFSAHWVRLVSDTACMATAEFHFT
jgi:hypothetical protein